MNLLDQKETSLNLITNEEINLYSAAKTRTYSKKIIEPSEEEIEMHKLFLKKKMKRNFF